MSIRIYFSEGVLGCSMWDELGIKKTPQGLVMSNNYEDDKPVLSDEIWQHVESYSLRVKWLRHNLRENGIYRYQTAEAIVENHVGTRSAEEIFVFVEVVGRIADDCHKLVEMIREGSIRPVKSFEGPQLGEPAYKLAEKIQKLLDHGGEEAARKLKAMLATTLPVLPPAENPNFLRPKVVI